MILLEIPLIATGALVVGHSAIIVWNRFAEAHSRDVARATKGR